jgi:hypothetical protein
MVTSEEVREGWWSTLHSNILTHKIVIFITKLIHGPPHLSNDVIIQCPLQKLHTVLKSYKMIRNDGELVRI